MACPVCENIERDLQDVCRQLQAKKAAQRRPFIVNRDQLDLEVRALSSAVAQIESRYSQHRTSETH